MHKKIVCILVLFLLFTSTLSTTFNVKSSIAEDTKSGLLNEEYEKKTGEAFQKGKFIDSISRKNEEYATRNTPEEWNFNETSKWRDYAYIDDNNNTRIIVGLKEGHESLLNLEEILFKNKAKIVNTIIINNSVKAVVVELPLIAAAAFIQESKITGLASYMEPNMKVQVQWVPNDPYWVYQWGPKKIEVDWAWNITIGSPTVLVAIIDTGIDYTHPDIATNYEPLGYDWVNMDSDPKDDFGHGTHCAGIIAAVLNNSIGVAGLAQVKLMAEKVLDSQGYGYWDWVANGIIHATESGAKIISMSFGGYGDSELVHTAVKYAHEAGVLLIAAAGNDNTNMKSYPAGYDEVIAVAATDQYDNKAWFSNWGDWIELAAPGVYIYSTMPTYWVTLNDWGYPLDYAYMSGTSMACPHVSGLAALLWSLYPEKTRDWIRLWLRYTTKDLGLSGFDVYYGFGRIDARKAVEKAPPEHELIAYAWQTPPYVKPGCFGIINATILNFGEKDETGITVQLLANDTLIDSKVIDFIASGKTKTVGFTWSPIVEGFYNVTFYVLPVSGETSVENNVLSKLIYVGFPVKAVVLHSAGNVYGNIITNWQVLSNQWYLFGNQMIYVDYTTLNKEGITYEDIVSTEADVLIISCAYDPYMGWQFTDSEIEAIKAYVYEGHGLIITAGTFYYAVPNNNKLAALIGINETITWTATSADLLHLLNITHPIFAKIPNPLVFPEVGTALPSDGRWDSNELINGKYLALGHYQEAAIVVCHGLVYISPWLEIIPAYYHHHLQLLYNTILWSRYQKPQHELAVSLKAPKRLNPDESTLINATVSNFGLNNETNVELQLFINGILVKSEVIPCLPADSLYTISYPWTPPSQGAYNITAYTPPIPGEEVIKNNIATVTLYVLSIGVRNVLVYTDDYAVAPSSRYVITALNNLGINYTHYYDDPWGFGLALISQTWDLVIVDHCNYYALGSCWTEIDEYVRSGGRLLISTFDIDGSNSEPTTLWETLGVRWVSDMWSPEPVYLWVPSHAIFNFPNAIGNFISYIEGYLDDGDHVAAITGTPIAGFTPSMMHGHAAIVVGNNYPTVLFSFIADEFRYDQDYDGKLDVIELWENAIVYLARCHEHDVAASLTAQKLLELGDSAIINATVYNRGANPETNVELQLIINGTAVESVLISELPVKGIFTLEYGWTPPSEGIYNITAYVPPVPDEEFIADNAKSIFVEVRILPDILIVADDDALNKIWGTSLAEFECALTYAGYEYIVWQESIKGRPSLDILAKFKLVIWTCGDYWRWAVDPVDAETLEAYLAIGGNIILEGEDIGYDHGNDLFMLNVAHATFQIDDTGAPGLTVIDLTHPVTQGLPETFAWFKNPPYDDGVFPAKGGYEVIRYAGTIWTAVTVFDGREAGLGSVVYYAFPIYCLSQPERDTLITNSLSWLIPQDHDLKVSLTAQRFLELGRSMLINATIQNRGLSNEMNVEFFILVNDTLIYHTIIDLLAGKFSQISFLWTAAELGSYNITAYAAPVPGETHTMDNIATKWVHVFFYKRFHVPHEWVGGGVPMHWHGDDLCWEYTLPFSFPFYGIPYETIYISSNGLLTFDKPVASPVNGISELADKMAIAVAWDDWVTFYPYDVYVWEDSTHVGIRWYVSSYDYSVVANFEVILSIDGVIQFNYAFCSGNVTATIGISNGDGHILAEDVTDINLINSAVFWPYPSAHDVAVVEVLPASNEVIAGDSVNINVSVENQGNFTESFELSLYAVESEYPSFTAVYLASTEYPVFIVINPGPDGYPEKWTTGPPRYVGTSDLIFYTNETYVGSTFFINVTAQNVERMMAWQIGLIYDSSLLQFVSAWLPSDHVFKPVVDMGWPLIAPPPADDYFDAVHRIVKWGCTYLMPEGEYWSFNGTGQLCQIQFRIIREPDEISPQLSASLDFDSEWTAIYQYPIGDKILPQMKSGYFKYLIPALPPAKKHFIGTVIVSSLTPGERRTIMFTWNTTGVLPGDYIIVAEADVLFDGDYEDNIYCNGIITIRLGVVHDVAVVDVVVPYDRVYQGWIVDINVTVMNLGNATETFSVTLYYGDIVIATETVNNLEPNASVVLGFSWDTINVLPCRNYIIKAVAIIVPGEVNVDNNVLVYGSIKVKIMGDINGDGRVSMDDVMLVIDSFGSYPSHLRWLFDADLDQNGRVTMGDIILVLLNFGGC